MHNFSLRITNLYYLKRIVWSVWSILLRTQHKGVLQKCGEKFHLIMCNIINNNNKINKKLFINAIITAVNF